MAQQQTTPQQKSTSFNKDKRKDDSKKMSNDAYKIEKNAQYEQLRKEIQAEINSYNIKPFSFEVYKKTESEREAVKVAKSAYKSRIKTEKALEERKKLREKNLKK